MSVRKIILLSVTLAAFSASTHSLAMQPKFVVSGVVVGLGATAYALNKFYDKVKRTIEDSRKNVWVKHGQKWVIVESSKGQAVKKVLNDSLNKLCKKVGESPVIEEINGYGI